MAQIVAHIDPYALGDSIEGFRVAAHQGSPAADVNIRTCRANWRPKRRRRAVCAHWSDWWEHGFEPKPGKHVPRKPIEDLKLRQVRKLRSVVGHHEIPTVEEALDEFKRLEKIPLFEMKPSTWTDQVLIRIRNHARKIGHPFAVMTIQAYGKTDAQKDRWERAAYSRLARAHRLEIPTVLLWRRQVDRSKWTPVLTGIKGHKGWTGVLGISATVKHLQRGLRW